MISANVLSGSYDYAEVTRSVLIAIAASYAGLDLAGRVTAASGRSHLAWLGGGAIAMGIGIWEMHFKGMLAFHLPASVEYHWPTALAALLVAIFASAVALYVSSRRKIGWVEALSGGVIMGAAIAGMHYIGMAAMRMAAIMELSSSGDVFHFVRNLVFSHGAIDGIRSTRGDKMDGSTQAWQCDRDGNRCLCDALHRKGRRKFYPCLASGFFPRCEHLSC